METKNLNESGVISTLQDNEYILVTMADGSVGRIKKSDLMPIVSSEKSGLATTQIFNSCLTSTYISSSGDFIKLGVFYNPHNEGGSVIINFSNQLHPLLLTIFFNRTWLDGAFLLTGHILAGDLGVFGNIYIIKGARDNNYELWIYQKIGTDMATTITFSSCAKFKPMYDKSKNISEYIISCLPV